MAKDPYTQRTIELIDRNGCPVDPSVFSALGLSRSGDGIETTFNAFKIPESNFLVFEATVNTCRGGCKPVRLQFLGLDCEVHRVSVQGVKSLGGHFAYLCRGFDFYEVRKN